MKELTQNFHTHTFRCRHAEGSDREYIEEAIGAGIKILGFSDHSPMLFDTPHKSGFRVQQEETEDYFCSLAALREEYKNEIDIKIGFEVEYYPGVFDRYIDYITSFPTEYLLLGQHFLWREEDGIAAFSPDPSEERLVSYLKNVTEAVRTGKFMYIAHPDVLNFTGNPRFYEEKIREFLAEMKRLDIPLGLNRYGYYDKRHYPNESFWRLAGEVGNRTVIELDAHSPDVLADEKSVEGLTAFARKYNVNIINDLIQDYSERSLIRK